MSDERKHKFLRLFELASQLTGSKGLTVAQLGGNNDRNRRRIQRDLEDLREMGFPLDIRPGSERTPAYFLPSVRNPAALLDLEETLAITLSLNSLGQSPLGQRARSAWTKLHYVVINGQERRLKNDLPSRIGASGPATPDLDTLTAICSALLEGRRLRISYRGLADSEPRWRLIEGVRLFFQEHWYLKALDTESKALRNFRLERILELQQTEEVCPPPECADEATAFHRWDLSEEEPTTVTFLVDEPLARWLSENPVHPSQKLEGTTVEVTIRDLDPFIRWTLSLTHCQILQPEAARTKYRHRLQHLTELAQQQ